MEAFAPRALLSAAWIQTAATAACSDGRERVAPCGFSVLDILFPISPKALEHLPGGVQTEVCSDPPVEAADGQAGTRGAGGNRRLFRAAASNRSVLQLEEAPQPPLAVEGQVVCLDVKYLSREGRSAMQRRGLLLQGASSSRQFVCGSNHKKQSW